MKRLPSEKLEAELGHSFRSKTLLAEALTHSSAGSKSDYERLEFLGDRVLGLVIAELLYEKFPDEAEGDMAKRLAALVQGELLAGVAAEIKLGAYITFSEAEALAGGASNVNILSDVFEALVGALYLDSGMKKCRALIERLWAKRLYDMKTPPQHPKTALQEWAQGRGLPLPVYKIEGQEGPHHAPVFSVELTVSGYKPVMAQGRSRQDAEKAAALAFLKENGLPS
ncbi:MAG: ribonuclease III [Alphaproteobacteria bacterium]|nr:ribonuclease III [Alphaproteobacteria bacterium]